MKYIINILLEKKTFWVWQDFYISEFGLERHILDWIEKFMSALVGKEYVQI